MYGLLNALKNGHGTDERLESIENQLRVIQSKYNSLIKFEPVKDETNQLDKDEPKPIINNQKEFYLNLIK